MHGQTLIEKVKKKTKLKKKKNIKKSSSQKKIKIKIKIKFSDLKKFQTYLRTEPINDLSWLCFGPI